MRDDKLVYGPGFKVDPRLNFDPPLPRMIVWEPEGVWVRAFETDDGGATESHAFAEAVKRIRSEHPDAWRVLEAAGVKVEGA